MSHWFNPKIYFSGVIIVFCILGFYFDAYALSRAEIISQTLDRQENPTEIVKGNYPRPLLHDIERGYVMNKTLDKVEFAMAIGMGYLYGDTSYEINFSEGGYAGRSELTFPFDTWLLGTDISVGQYPFYLNFSGWTNMLKKENGGMEDKDWIDGYLFSSTESDNKAKIATLDVNLLYNFWEGEKPWGDVANAFKKGRYGFLVGYRYENFKYDIIGVKDLFTGISYYPGQKVLDYEVQYHIPYLGLNWQYFSNLVDNTLNKWGINIQVCGSPYVYAKDRDDHLMRNKLIEGKATGYAYLIGLNTFFETKNNWIWKFGLDYSGIRTEGKQKQYWYGDDPATIADDTGSSIEGINLRVMSSQCLLWGRLQYNF
jgi:outer membrane protease